MSRLEVPTTAVASSISPADTVPEMVPGVAPFRVADEVRKAIPSSSRWRVPEWMSSPSARTHDQPKLAGWKRRRQRDVLSSVPARLFAAPGEYCEDLLPVWYGPDLPAPDRRPVHCDEPPGTPDGQLEADILRRAAVWTTPRPIPGTARRSRQKGGQGQPQRAVSIR